ncbi:MAG: glycosyltransferase [Anaerolineales bacterium]|nr:glycosyltransferase [Anaerolineales bacterium]
MISIIVPAYNAARTLPACLAALQRQTQLPDEIIVVDDGSQDQTAQVARAYGVQLLEQPHQGPAVARNLGIHQASGDIILLTDADCEPEPAWVAEMTRPFSDPRVAGGKGSYRTHQQERVARLAQCEFEERYDLLERLETIDFIDTYAAAFRTSVLRESGGFDPAFSQANNEDVDLSYRLAKKGLKLVFNRQAVVYHRHPATWGAYLRLKIKRGYWRMMAYRLHPGKAVRDSYTPQLLKAQLALMYLVLGLAGLAFVLPPLGWGAVAALIVLCFSAIPFIRRAIQQDNALRIPALVFIVVRALAFAIGVAGGTMGMFFFRPTLPRKRER